MGKCETATASLGVRILLSDLIQQLNGSNSEIIKHMLTAGYIEDSNGYFNEAFKNIVGYGDYENEMPEDDLKEYLTKAFLSNGSFFKYKFSPVIEPDLTSGTLYQHYLLVPVQEILSTERWGYERYGINSSSRPVDFDLDVNLVRYKEITGWTKVFLICQHSG